MLRTGCTFSLVYSIKNGRKLNGSAAAVSPDAYDATACRALYCAIIERAYLDAIGDVGTAGVSSGGRNHANYKVRESAKKNRERIIQDAQHFFLTQGNLFDSICEILGINPGYIRRELIAELGRRKQELVA